MADSSPYRQLKESELTMAWITVPNWQRFQHYGLARRPVWIKNHLALLHKDEYLDLPLAARGLLHGIWLSYADRDGRLRESDLPSILLGRARDAHLSSLSHAGLIEFSASRPLSLHLEEAEAVTRARARARPQRDRDFEKARNWIRNGAAAEVPPARLVEVIIEDFHVTDPDLMRELVAHAQEFH
jgi:hypothetical protein